MIDWLQLAEDLVSSPWLYVILLSVSLLDSFLPAIPSEPVIVVAGVAAADGDVSLVGVIAATAVGAFLGDLVPYGIGRVSADPILKRLPAGSKRRATHDWLSAELARRAGYVLITSRFIPVGRYLVTLSAGISKLHWPTFAGYTAISVITWSAYTVLAGYLGGKAFQDNALLAIGVGLGLALVVSVTVEAVRYIGRRTRTA